VDEAKARRVDLAASDKRIDDLVLRAEQLVADLNSTVLDMKQILGNAARRGQEVGDEQRHDRG
jgi:hypothetical protein